MDDMKMGRIDIIANKNKGIYIPKIEAKDLYITNRLVGGDYSLKRADGKTNYKRFKASLDYSLDLIKMREVYESVYRNKKFSEKYKGKEYSPYVINVTFNLSVKEFNRAGQNTYVKAGIDSRKVDFEDCIALDNGKLIGIVTDKEFESPVDKEVLGDYFYIENGKYYAKNNIKTIKSVSELRKDLYKNGFNIDGTHYIRYKRSAGSARVGRCLFIAEPLFKKMRKWENCGLDIKPGCDIDLAAYESYISLTSSSVVGTMEIEPHNILVIDDYDSVFSDDVVCVTESSGVLETTEMRATIENCIWDGQSIMDKSLMPEEYQDKGMLLLRNRFFKSCCFNGNVQQWFEDNNVTDVSQLNGFTLAEDIKDVKLVTTPSSIKYLKFGTLQQWFDNLDPTFGIVKYEKEQHYFDGRMTQCHYQLINSIQMSRAEVEQLLKPTFDFMTLVKDEPAALRRWIKFDISQLDEITPAASKTDVVYKLMSMTPDFARTKLYHDFKTDFLKSFTKNLKCGHVLINGNYSTLCGNPISMLRSAIGKFDGTSEFAVGTVCSTRFDWNKRLLGSRSPHITMSNVLVAENRYNAQVDKYMNATPQIVYINTINENTMQRLAGSDFDSDTILITDNEVLINAASRNINKFKVAVCDVSGVKTKRMLTPEDQADLDIKTSKNIIGSIINTSQELNTQIWNALANGARLADINDVYLDVCKLSVMSNIAIDEAKREFAVNNKKELSEICEKRKLKTPDGRQVKPNFFGHISRLKGYYDPEKKAYIKHDTSMDYLETAINSYRARRGRAAAKEEFIEMSDLLDTSLLDYKKVDYRQINTVIAEVDKMNDRIKSVCMSDVPSDEKTAKINDLRQSCIDNIGKISFGESTMVAFLKLLESPEHSYHKRTIMYTLFSYPNTSFYNVLIKSKKPIPRLIECDDGDIDIYGVRFKKIV